MSLFASPMAARVLEGRVLCIRIFVSGSDSTKVNHILNKHQVLAGLGPSEHRKSYIAHRVTDGHCLDAPLCTAVQRSCGSFQSRLAPMELLLSPPCPLPQQKQQQVLGCPQSSRYSQCLVLTSLPPHYTLRSNTLNVSAILCWKKYKGENTEGEKDELAPGSNQYTLRLSAPENRLPLKGSPR